MGRPARGNAIQIGLRPERSHNIPGAYGDPYEWLKTHLPVNLDLTRTEEESGQVNKSGYTEAGIPGFIAGDGASVPIPMTAGLLLPWLQHLLGSSVANGTLTKTTLEAGEALQYEFEPDPDGIDQSVESIFGHPPVVNSLGRGIKFGTMGIGVTGAGEIPVTLGGFISHGTDLGPGEADAGNTGTYVLGPHLRGILADYEAGDVWVRVTGTAPLTFKVIQSAAAPADPADWDTATEYTVETDPVTGEGLWQTALGATGLDLGIWTSENKDPLEVVFPGDAAAHGDAAEGDTWRFRVSWDLPAATYLPTTGRRFGMPHWRNFQRDLGAGVWVEDPLRQLTLNLAWPVTPDNGSGTRYYTALDRDEPLAPTFSVQRTFIDTTWKRRMEKHERFEVRELWEGKQLGTGQYRESVDIVAPSVGIRSRSKDSPRQKITESIDFTAETDGAGSAPITVTVITDRDWTPAT